MTRPVLAGTEQSVNGSAARSSSRDGATQASSNAVCAHLEHLAALHEELASTYRELGRDLDIQLAAFGESRLLEPVPSNDEVPELLTTADVARILCASDKTVRTWHREGHIPKAIEVGGVLRWRRSDIESWLEEQSA